jgi:hypothetical protein
MLMKRHQSQLLRLIQRHSATSLVGAEIGVAAGETSACLLEQLPQLHLYMIDS